MKETNINTACRTMTVEMCATVLGISRAAAYNLVRTAVDTGEPFRAIRLGKSVLVSKQSFNEYLAQNGL